MRGLGVAAGASAILIMQLTLLLASLKQAARHCNELSKVLAVTAAQLQGTLQCGEPCTFSSMEAWKLGLVNASRSALACTLVQPDMPCTPQLSSYEL